MGNSPVDWFSNRARKPEQLGPTCAGDGAQAGPRERPSRSCQPEGHPGQLFIEVNLNAGDADIPETEGKLLVDARGNLGVLEGLGAREAVEIGSITGDELLLGGGGHGYD
ncbi:hypothetical protein DVH24_042500 [Malus domestica]|uniref:Uncharacterized protein n=1 Tax=Malus domestica TaxID=3750 RepID=A0A498JC65_MALDO|nr:hypothetical protein DVH24_042500 [Malus domestica]